MGNLKRTTGWRTGVLVLAPVAGIALGGVLCCSQGPAQKEPELRVIRPPGVVAAPPEGDASNVRPEQAPTRGAASNPMEAEPKAFQAIEDPSGRALEPFFSRLRRIEGGEKELKARVLHYGDSHIAADFWTGELRRHFQTKFGDGGHGFMLPGKPWRSYRHLDAENGVDNRKRWKAERVRGKKGGVKDKLYGLGGVTVWSSKAGSYVWVGTKADGALGTSASEFEVYYLQQPRGGTFDVLIDDRRVESVKTRARKAGPGYVRHTAPEGAHTYKVKVAGKGEVRLFGLVMERSGSGVVYDSVGINGARATTSMQWDVDLWQAHMTRRAPNLLVTTYGTNEAASSVGPERHARELGRVLRIMREAVPDAACLVIAPPDLGRRTTRPAVLKAEAGSIGMTDEAHFWKTSEPLIALVDVQRKVASEAGCAFWNTYEAMSGEGSIDRWARESPPRATKDRIHLTVAGYEWVAEQLFVALMDAYERQAP